MTSAFRLTTVIRRYLTYLCKQQFSMIFLVKTCFQDVLVIKKKIKKSNRNTKGNLKKKESI